ncbi:MAG TPA: hypothetical protein VL137_15810 [Polyangiaceae bacterium]|nr:hypothetical protein [Polyangiaceae bacterium]
MIAAKIVSLSLIASGAGLFGVIGYMQHHHPESGVKAEPVAAAPLRVFVDKPVEVAPPAEPTTVVLPPMVVKEKKISRSAPVAKPPTRVPCSGWRDLGYQHVDNGQATGVSRVREICPPEAPSGH